MSMLLSGLLHALPEACSSRSAVTPRSWRLRSSAPTRCSRAACFIARRGKVVDGRTLARRGGVARRGGGRRRRVHRCRRAYARVTARSRPSATSAATWVGPSDEEDRGHRGHRHERQDHDDHAAAGIIDEATKVGGADLDGRRRVRHRLHPGRPPHHHPRHPRCRRCSAAWSRRASPRRWWR